MPLSNLAEYVGSLRLLVCILHKAHRLIMLTPSSSSQWFRLCSSVQVLQGLLQRGVVVCDEGVAAVDNLRCGSVVDDQSGLCQGVEISLKLFLQTSRICSRTAEPPSVG